MGGGLVEFFNDHLINHLKRRRIDVVIVGHLCGATASVCVAVGCPPPRLQVLENAYDAEDGILDVQAVVPGSKHL